MSHCRDPCWQYRVHSDPSLVVQFRCRQCCSSFRRTLAPVVSMAKRDRRFHLVLLKPRVLRHLLQETFGWEKMAHPKALRSAVEHDLWCVMQFVLVVCNIVCFMTVMPKAKPTCCAGLSSCCLVRCSAASEVKSIQLQFSTGIVPRG
jgi:hypothetical protein